MARFRIARCSRHVGADRARSIKRSRARTRNELGEVNFPISCSAGGAAAIQSRRRDAAFVLLSRDREGVHRHRREGTVLRHGLLGHCHQPAAQSAGRPVPRRCPQARLGSDRKGARGSAKTEREIAWIEALAAFYQDYATVPQRTRTANYEAAMARLSARYPDDAEAAIFYALALNEAADPADKTYARQLKAADILEKLEPKYPNHPGIPHYIIHSYDYPELAMRGAIAAARCAQLAPSAPHALHMPSHIFSTLGMWDRFHRGERKDHRGEPGLCGEKQSRRDLCRRSALARLHAVCVSAAGAGRQGEAR